MLGRFPERVSIAVAWGDMDAFRHVNNTVYLRWFETARIAYFERIGLVQYGGVGPILARASVDFRRAVTYPDTVDVDVTVAKFGTTSFEMRYRARSRALDAIAAEGDGVIVMFDYATNAKVPLSGEVRAAIEALESTGAG